MAECWDAAPKRACQRPRACMHPGDCGVKKDVRLQGTFKPPLQWASNFSDMQGLGKYSHGDHHGRHLRRALQKDQEQSGSVYVYYVGQPGQNMRKTRKHQYPKARHDRSRTLLLAG